MAMAVVGLTHRDRDRGRAAPASARAPPPERRHRRPGSTRSPRRHRTPRPSAGTVRTPGRSVFSPSIAPSCDHERVHRVQQAGIVGRARRRGPRSRSLWGIVMLAPSNPSATSPSTACGNVVRRHRQRHVDPMHPQRSERSVVDRRRQAVLDRPSDHPQEFGRPRPLGSPARFTRGSHRRCSGCSS